MHVGREEKNPGESMQTARKEREKETERDPNIESQFINN